MNEIVNFMNNLDQEQLNDICKEIDNLEVIACIFDGFKEKSIASNAKSLQNELLFMVIETLKEKGFGE